MITVMEILNKQQIIFAKGALEISSTDKLAVSIKMSPATLRRIEQKDETVRIDTAIKARQRIDAKLFDAGWEFIENGGIRTIEAIE